MRVGTSDESRFLFRSAVVDYDSNRIEEARTKFLQLADQDGNPPPEVFEYLYLICKYESPADQNAAELWNARYVEAISALAREGNAGWQLKLATMHQFGDRVPIDCAYTRDTLERLASAGNSEAQYQYAGLFKHGYCGLQLDLEKYAGWLEASAKGGFPDAQYEFAMMLLAGDVSREDRSRALALLNSAAQAGFRLAQDVLDELHR